MDKIRVKIRYHGGWLEQETPTIQGYTCYWVKRNAKDKVIEYVFRKVHPNE